VKRVKREQEFVDKPTMVKFKSNHHRYNIKIHQTQKRSLLSLLASSNLRRWIIILLLFYKLDYKDYYCYGISSSSAILNNENGKKFSFPFLILFYWKERAFKYQKNQNEKKHDNSLCNLAFALESSASQFVIFSMLPSSLHLLVFKMNIFSMFPSISFGKWFSILLRNVFIFILL
jgi:hypothetical protein